MIEADPPVEIGQPMMTVQQHIAQQQRLYFPNASGEFSWLLSGITLATKMIQAQVRRAGLVDILGAVGHVNPQGEVQQKLDIFANKVLLGCLGTRETVGVLVSEEDENPVTLRHHAGKAAYAVIFDPLDGSSNIDVNVSVGTIFSILRCSASTPADDTIHAILQKGSEQVAAGYVLYGSATVFVYTAGRGVHLFTLDPAVGAYILTEENVTMPAQGPYYSVNEAYRDAFSVKVQRYLDRLRQGALGHEYASRYVGSLVADFHRTLIKGGVFLYPATAKHPQGKLRLMYEANPIAFIAEQAGGRAIDGTSRILDIAPDSIHQRTPLIVGGKREVEAFEG